MHRIVRMSVMIGMICTPLTSYADPHINASLAGVAGDSQGLSSDADAPVSTGTWWGLGGGGGVTRSASTIGMLDGTTERALAEVQAHDFGLRGYYRHWAASPLDNQTTGLRPSWTHADLTLSGIAEWRRFSVNYSDTSAEDAQSVATFSGQGFGGGLKYVLSPWSASVDAVWYSFDSLAQYAAQQSTGGTPSAGPTTPGGPVILRGPTLPPILSGTASRVLPSLPTSVLSVVPSLASSPETLEQGALQHLITTEVARDFGRASVCLDWSNARDVVLQTDINNYSGSYRQQFNDCWSGTLTLGTADSAYGTFVFGGFALGLVL